MLGRETNGLVSHRTLPRTSACIVRLGPCPSPSKYSNTACETRASVEGQTRLRGRDPRVLKRVFVSGGPAMCLLFWACLSQFTDC